MKVFQAIHKYNPYIPNFEARYDVTDLNFEDHLKLVIKDRFYGLHILKPILDFEVETSFYTIWDYDTLQRKWANENGIPNATLKEILWAQIEEFKPDVFYTASPTLFEKEDLKNISRDILKVCWASSPDMRLELLSEYDLRLTNYPGFLKDESSKLVKTELFEPSFDPVMSTIKEERDIDLLFYGQYNRGSFRKRNELIDNLCKFKSRSNLNIKICLQTKIQTIPIIDIRGIRRYLRMKYPRNFVLENQSEPVYGLELYRMIARSKIVFNAAVDFTRGYKVNMRNFEVLGLETMMISDNGIYPAGFKKGVHFATYSNFHDFKEKLNYYLENEKERTKIALEGNKFIKNTYNKDFQWIEFQRLIGKI